MLETALENERPEINHLGISGGKDSTALLLWALHESSYPRETLRATFCDTGNEHPFAYAYIRYLSETVFPIEWLTPDLDFYRLARKKKRFPSARARFCTTELKIRPTRDYVHSMLRQGYSVRMHTGVRAAESRARAALAERDYDPDFLSEVYRPLLKWTLQQVLEIHVRWSQTSHGGVQYRLNLELREEMDEEVPSCASNCGLCE